MQSTSPAAAPVPPPLFANEALRALRATYIKSLQSDRVTLVDLATELARCDRDPLEQLTQIRLVAHRMRGAAAIFDVPTVGDAAAALEMTTWAAVTRRPKRSDPEVNSALGSLVDCLARIAGSSTA